MPKPNIYTLSEFRKLKGKQKAPVAVFLTASEYKNFKKSAALTDQKPSKTGIALVSMDLPEGEGMAAPIVFNPKYQIVLNLGTATVTPGTIGCISMIELSPSGGVACGGTCRSASQTCKPLNGDGTVFCSCESPR